MSFHDLNAGTISTFPKPGVGRAHDGALSPFPRASARTGKGSAHAAGGVPPFVDSGQKGQGAVNTLSPSPRTPLLNTPLPNTFDKWR
jgi:hypothetical protein